MENPKSTHITQISFLCFVYVLLKLCYILVLVGTWERDEKVNKNRRLLSPSTSLSSHSQGQQNQAYQQVICIKSVIFHNQSPCRTRSLLTPRSYLRMAAKQSASDLGLHTGNVLRGSRMTIVAKNTAPDNTLITGLVLTNVLRRCFLNMSNRGFGRRFCGSYSRCYHLNKTLFWT